MAETMVVRTRICHGQYPVARPLGSSLDQVIWCVPCLRCDQLALQARALLAHLSALDFLSRGGFLLVTPLANH
jgi:hypothetical protein